jgi:hypothetical protein
MKWNKLTLRELTEEEQEEYGYKMLWDGTLPELDEEVLVTYPLSSGEFVNTRKDTWIEIGDEVGFENTDNGVIYWMKIPQYNGELDE